MCLRGGAGDQGLIAAGRSSRVCAVPIRVSIRRGAAVFDGAGSCRVPIESWRDGPDPAGPEPNPPTPEACLAPHFADQWSMAPSSREDCEVIDTSWKLQNGMLRISSASREDRAVIDIFASGRHARPSRPSSTSTSSRHAGGTRAMTAGPPPVTVAGACVPRRETTRRDRGLQPPAMSRSTGKAAMGTRPGPRSHVRRPPVIPRHGRR